MIKNAPFYFGRDSEQKLSTCHGAIQVVARTLIQFLDVKIICGYRGEDAQNAAYYAGLSQLSYPHSNHNHVNEAKKPESLAIDMAPYYDKAPHIRWEEKRGFYYMAGVTMRIADELGTAMRWGGDWDGDADFVDQTFMDLCHFEMIGAI